MTYKKEWDAFLASYNAQASRFAQGAWHSSTLWVTSEAQQRLISSTAETLAIAVGLAFLGASWARVWGSPPAGPWR